MKVKQPSVAGSFYPDDKDELLNLLEYFKSVNKNTYQYKTRAVIVPHAGLIYSGRLAYEGISQLDKQVENIFIIGPSHKVAFNGLALSGFNFWQTPLGITEINQDICLNIRNTFNVEFNDVAMQPEHSIEVEIPFIQNIFNKNIKIVPILVGRDNGEKIKDIIEYYYNDHRNAFIISSDLSHFFTDKDAKQIDEATAQIIENNDYDNLSHDRACGATGIIGLMQFSKSNGFSLIRTDMINSSKISSDTSSVVGYGTWFLYEGNKNEFIKQYYSDFLIDLCKNTLEQEFAKQYKISEYPKILDQQGACFVTLEKNNHLRGCIGSIIAYRSLFQDITEHTKNAAFHDNRFSPLSYNELPYLQYAISILSVPTKIIFNDEQDLLNKIVKDKDGIIIQDKNHSAVYLPCVWEQIQDKQEFLNSLKVKAGLQKDYFSTTFQAYRFDTTYIK